MATAVTTVQAAEIGKQYNFPLGSNAPTLMGASVTLLVTSPAAVLSTYTCTLPATGSTPFIITTGNEFPVAGTYQVQLQYVASGEKYYTQTATLKVLPNLG